MSEKQDPKAFSDLDQRIAKVRDEAGLNKPDRPDDDAPANMMGMAYRVSAEIVVALVICTAIGWGLDTLFGWTPWAMLVGLFLGAAAGINNAAKVAMRMDAMALEELQAKGAGKAGEADEKPQKPEGE